jgi:hypothetical protein
LVVILRLVTLIKSDKLSKDYLERYAEVGIRWLYAYHKCYSGNNIMIIFCGIIDTSESAKH